MSNERVVILMHDSATVADVKEYERGSNAPIGVVLDWLHDKAGGIKNREVWSRRTRVSSSPWDTEPVGYVEWQHYYIDSHGFVQHDSVVEPPKIILMHLLMRNL